MKTERETLRRYTNLAGALHLLSTKRITLLDPERWDDGNDVHFMKRYKEVVRAKSVAALCFAQDFETFHHWRVFSSGTDGVCFEFDKPKLVEIFSNEGGIECREVRYEEINALAKSGIRSKDLPFVKRLPYRPESEFRVVHTNLSSETPYPEFGFRLNCINRITLSPWMPKPLVKSVKGVIKGIPGCKSLKVYQTTLIDNKRWKEIANKAT